MMEFKFDDSQVMICEDTARAIVYNPTEDNKKDIIEFIFSNNYICAGVLTEGESLLRYFHTWCKCIVSEDLNEVKKVEASFT